MNKPTPAVFTIYSAKLKSDVVRFVNGRSITFETGCVFPVIDDGANPLLSAMDESGNRITFRVWKETCQFGFNTIECPVDLYDMAIVSHPNTGEFPITVSGVQLIDGFPWVVDQFNRAFPDFWCRKPTKEERVEFAIILMNTIIQ